MAIGSTPRFGLVTWGSGDDAFTRDQMNSIMNALDSASSGAAGFGQGAGTAGRSAAEYKGFFWFDETADVLYYYDGATWHTIYGSGMIVAGNLATDAVETAKIKDGAVTNVKLAGSITADKIVSLATTQLTGTITNAQLGSNIVTEAKIGTAAVTAVKLAPDAVETVKIKDASVTNPKLASGIDGAKITGGNVPDSYGPTQHKMYWDYSSPTERIAKIYVDTAEPTGTDGDRYDIWLQYA